MNREAAANVTPVRQRTQYDWANLPLGVIPDHILAAQLGCQRQTVLKARHRLGISPHSSRCRNKQINWDDVDLGCRSDIEIATELGVATSVVCNARNRRNVEPFTSRVCLVDWDTAPLGEYPDRVVAEELGISEPTVSRHRNAKGITPHRCTFLTPEGEGTHSYDEALIDLYWHEHGTNHQFQVRIGKYVVDWVVDGIVVEYAGFINSPRFGQAYKDKLDRKIQYYKAIGKEVLIIYPDDLGQYTPEGRPLSTRDIVSGGVNWSQQPLGKMSDTDLARKLEVTQGTVSYQRRRLGIPVFSTVDWDSVPLGKATDKELATRLGVHKNTVRNARVRKGIPSFRSRKNV